MEQTVFTAMEQPKQLTCPSNDYSPCRNSYDRLPGKVSTPGPDSAATKEEKQQQRGRNGNSQDQTKASSA